MMKKILNVFFVILGVIFFIIILIGIYLFVADPYNLKPLILGSGTGSSTVTQGSSSAADNTPNAAQDSADQNPVLNQDQETALQAVGIDPTTVPSTISPEQESCFIDTIGAARVEAIKAGDSPTALEIFAGRNCL